jgi:NitT/TauT family transport system ATP-binding protein
MSDLSTHPPQDVAASATPASRTGGGYVEFAGVTKRYQTRRGSTLALSDINLSVEREEFIALVGRSGCGKTTMLRILAGLVQPTEGEVTVDGTSVWNGARRDDRALSKLGLVFQDSNLFPCTPSSTTSRCRCACAASTRRSGAPGRTRWPSSSA